MLGDVTNGRFVYLRFVYLLWHGDDLGEGTPEAKLLGVYSSEDAVRDRIARTLRAGVPGFADHPNDFHVAKYEVDRDQWDDGYVEIDPGLGAGPSGPD
jgi:hypothetical protein